MLFLFLLKQNYFMDKFLIVGLGNPDEKYRNTRHNIGFEILDFICEKYESRNIFTIVLFISWGR